MVFCVHFLLAENIYLQKHNFLILDFIAAAPNVFATSDPFCGRQFFPWSWGGGGRGNGSCFTGSSTAHLQLCTPVPNKPQTSIRPCPN